MKLAELVERQTAKLRDAGEQNRINFPFVEPWKAALEIAFGPIKVTHAMNGTREVGERFEDRCKREGHVPCTYWPNGVGHG